MVVRRSEMRGHPGKEVGCPQKRWMMEVCSTALLQVGKNCFCMNRSCSSLFGIGGGILVSVSAPVSQWLVRGWLLAQVEFCKTWLVLLFGDAVPGTPIQAAGSCQLVNSYCGTG